MATAQLVMILRSLVSLAAPTAVAIAAFLHARAIGSLVDGAVSPSSVAPPASIAPFVEARAEARSGAAILERNPFDSAYARPGAAADPVDEADPRNARACDGVRAVATVRGETADASFAALEVNGKSVLVRRGGGPGGNVVVYVGEDRVWLRQNGVLCQSRVFGAAVTPPVASVTPGQGTALERELGSKIVRSGEHEYQIDRDTLERIFEAQSELLKVPLVPEKDGLRMVRVKPGSLPALAGLSTGDRLVTVNGFDVTSPERMLEAYARLRSGADMIRLRIVRNGAPVDLDYAVR